MNKIDLILHDTGLEYNLEGIEEFCCEVMKRLQIDSWHYSLVFCSDAYIRDLNNTYRGKNEPTDILSFCENDSEGWEGMLPDENEPFYAGDIFISVDSLKKNAETFNEQEIVELKRLLIHGILHLKGHLHNSNEKIEPMIKIQEEILKDFGDFKF
jgi:probable rRNA maturation factor